MKINAISQGNLKKTQKQNKINTYKTNALQMDSVSFGKGKYEKETKPKWRFTLPAILTSVATIVSGCNSNNNVATNPTTTTPTYLAENYAIQETAPLSAVSLLQEHNDFQLRQTMDSVSLAFDFTDNYKAWEIEPNMSSVVIAKNPNKTHIEEFKDLKSAIVEAYEVKEQDTPIIRSIAHSILKANPESMRYVISKETGIDYKEGEITNIDLDTILNTNYSKGGNFRIELPKVTIMAERRNDYDTTLQVSAEFLPADRNENNTTTITFNKDDFKKAKTNEAKLELIGATLAEAYGIPTFNSYAGDAIWHGVALYEENYEIFKGVSEEDTKKALLAYINENGSAELTLPRIAATVMSSQAEEISDDILTQEKELGVTISYMTVSQPVFDLNGKNSFRPIDVIESVQFKDGSNLKEAYEENADKYESLALAAWQQQVDNNNALIKYYGANTIEAEDLYVEIKTDEVDLEDGKINLQPVAIAHPDCKMTCEPEIKPPRKQTPEQPEETQAPTDEPTKPTQKPSEPTTPSEPTKPSEPSEPTDPSTEPTDPPTEPTTPPETQCPTEPPIEKPDKPIDVTKPTLPTRPQETTPPETQCPTEPNMPNTGENKNPIEGDEGGFEQDPQPTTPPETQAPCPTEGKTPDTNENDNNIKGDKGGFDEQPQATQPAPQPTTPPAPQPTTPPATEAPCPTEAPSSNTNQNNNNVQGSQGGFESDVAPAKTSVEVKSTPKAETKAEPAPAKQEPKSEPKSEVKSEPKSEPAPAKQENVAQAPVTSEKEVAILQEEQGFDFE